MTEPIYFPKAGKVIVDKYVNGVPVRSATTSYFRNGAVQQVTPNITINGSPIADGNSLWNAANPDTSIEGTVAVQFGFMPPGLYSLVVGDTVTNLSSTPFPVIDHEIVIPDITPYTVKLPHAPIATNPIILVDKDAKSWTKVTETPKTGEYILAGDTLTFVAADAGKSLYITYEYTAATAKSYGLPTAPVRPALRLTIAGDAMTEDETPCKAAIIVDKCKVLGAINPPPQGGAPQPVTITFTIQKPRGNNRAVDFLMTT